MGNGHEIQHAKLKCRKQQHIQERSAIFSQLNDEIAELHTAIQGVISCTKDMERVDNDAVL